MGSLSRRIKKAAPFGSALGEARYARARRAELERRETDDLAEWSRAARLTWWGCVGLAIRAAWSIYKRARSYKGR